MARALSKIPVGKIKSLRVSQREKLSQQKYEKEKARKAANVAQYEKEKAARATTGSKYGYDTMGGNVRSAYINTNARTFREFIEITEGVSDRAKSAVSHQRQGTYGDDHELTSLQRDTQSSVDKLAKREKVTRAGAHIAAKKVKADVRKSSAYGPQRPKPGTTGAYRVEETAIVKQETPPTPEEKRKISLIQKLARLKAAAKGSAMISDVATKEEVEIGE